MHDSPDRQWRQLTAHYAQMWDDELFNLAADYNDLTDMAKQVLRDEMRKRNLGDPSAPSEQTAGISTKAASTPRKIYDILAGPLVTSYIVPEENASIPDDQHHVDAGGHEFTWKTRLCDCDEVLEAQQLAAALHEAGIESWVEAMPGYAIGVGRPRVFVPADQFEEAQRILVQPIPQDMIDESKIEVSDYQLPHCPRCQDQEPTLIATEPSNRWLCESCGNEWSDPIAESNRI